MEAELSSLGYEDNRTIAEFLGNWERIQVAAPSLAQAILDAAKEEHVLVAKMPPYIKKLIREGRLKLQLDKQGEIMAILRSTEKNEWVKQLRLEDMSFAPNVTQSLNHLTNVAMMAQILNEIESVGESVRRVHEELQGDRIALAESAWEKLLQARRMESPALRELATISAIHAATDAKRMLMRGFERSRRFVEQNSGKGELQMLAEFGRKKDLNSMAEDAFQDLVALTNVVRAECEGYAMLEEYENAARSLESFEGFIKQNKLDDRNTLLVLNGALKEKRVAAVEEFSSIAKNIERLRRRGALGARSSELLPETEGEDKSVKEWYEGDRAKSM
ncbi:MAG: hypothetical protein UDM07_09960 [Adlercreutzia sp.]|nr:hypothetical protein [Adlercreutzia sp.]